MYSLDSREVLPLLPYFVAIADTGQVTRAAAVLAVPQPTVTRGLQRLQRRLGVVLLERNGRLLRLTADGEKFLPYARAALQRASEGLRSLRVPLRGTVRVAFQNTLGQELVPAVIRAFRVEHPDVTFRLLQGSRHTCLESLQSGRADVSFVSPLGGAADGLNSVDLGADELVVVVGREHRLAGRSRLLMSELAHEPFILLAPEYGLRATVEHLCRAASFTPDIAFEAQDIQTAVGLVSAGLGITVVPRRNYSVPVCQLRVGGPGAVRHIFAVSLAGGGRLSPSAAFWELIARQGRHLASAVLSLPE